MVIASKSVRSLTTMSQSLADSFSPFSLMFSSPSRYTPTGPSKPAPRFRSSASAGGGIAYSAGSTPYRAAFSTNSPQGANIQVFFMAAWLRTYDSTSSHMPAAPNREAVRLTLVVSILLRYFR